MLAELLRARAAAAPDGPAFVVAGGDTLTFQSWDRRSDAVARGLRRRAVGPGDRVVLRFDAREFVEFALAAAGAHKAGGVIVPVAAHASVVELGRVVRHSGAAAVLEPATLVELEEAGNGAAGAAVVAPPDPAPDPVEVSFPLRPLRRPEAIPHRAADILSLLDTLDAGASVTSMLHASAIGSAPARWALWFPLGPHGGPVVTVPGADPEHVCALTAAHRVTRWVLDPLVAAYVLDTGATDGADLSSVRQLVLPGGRSRPDVLARLAARFPAVSLVSVASAADGEPAGAAFRYSPDRPRSVGRAVGGAGVRVVDDDGIERPDGEVGRLQLPRTTAGPAADAEWLPTADLAYVDGGFLYVVAGEHEVVRRGDATVSLAEVADALRGHPAVADAAVLAVPDERQAVQLAAAAVLRAPVAVAALEDEMRRRLGPTRAPDVLVVVDRIPRNRAGVVLRARLAELAGLPRPRAHSVASGDEVERVVAAVWARVLARGEIGAHDDLFELGGDELAAVKVLSLVEDALGVEVSLPAFLQAPTVAGLTALVAAADRRSAPASAVAPVAASQEGMLWQEQLVPGSQNLPPLARRYRGPLDLDVLGRALTEIVRRHEPLRTSYALQAGKPVQIVAPPRPLALDVRDLGDRPPDEQADEVARFLADARRPLDLVEGPLFAPTVLRLGPEDHVVVFRVHHSVYDDWSVGVFRRELSALYAALAEDGPTPLTELPVTFRDFARGQRRRLAGEAGGRELAWWRRNLAGAPLALQLPVDDPALPAGARQASPEPVSVTLPAEVHAHLQALARRERATVFTTVLAAVAAVLCRYTDQSELLLTSVVANRNRVELEGMVGCFTKKVVLRIDVTGEPSFTELVGRARSALLGALSHQDLPFEAVLQEVLGPAAAASGVVPQPAVIFQGVTPGAGDVVLPGLTTEGYETSSTTRRAHFAAAPEDGSGSDGGTPWGAGVYLGTFLILSVVEAGHDLSLVARGAFWGPAGERLLAHLSTVLTDAVAHPSRPVSELARDDDRESASQRTATGEDLAGNRGLAELFAEQVARTPSADAVREGAEVLSFAELDARAASLAARIGAAGVGAGAFVGLGLPPSVDGVVGVLAVWKVGAAYVGLDPGDDPEHLTSVLEQTGVDVVLAAPGAPGDAFGRARRHVAVGGDAGDRRIPSPPEVGPDAPAVAFYGCGPSAVPGGVVLDQEAVAALLAGLREAVYGPAAAATGRHRLRIGLSVAPTEDAFLRQLVALLDGHTLVVSPRGAGPGAQGVVDVVDCLPRRLPDLAGGAPPVVVLGSRTPPRGEERAAAARLGGAVVHHLFGPPECGFAATSELAAEGGPRLTIGRPLAHVRADVLDASRRPVPLQVPGELHVGGPGLARVATEKPARHATGLVARRLPDGRIEVLGAVAGTTALRGLRVDRGRLEAVLARHPAVRHVTVTVEEVEPGDPHLVAHVVPAGGEPPTPAGLRAHLWRELPGYPWPRRLVLADGHGAEARQPQAPPPTPEERLLANLWADVLGVERIPVDENYWQRFSFLDAVARAREAGVRLDDAQLSRNRTIAGLAVDLAAERARRAGPTDPG